MNVVSLADEICATGYGWGPISQDVHKCSDFNEPLALVHAWHGTSCGGPHCGRATAIQINQILTRFALNTGLTHASPFSS